MDMSQQIDSIFTLKKQQTFFHDSSHSVLHDGRGAVALSPSWLLPIELNHPLQCFWTLVTLVNQLRYHSDHQLQPWLFVLYCYAFVCFNVMFYGFYHSKPLLNHHLGICFFQPPTSNSKTARLYCQNRCPKALYSRAIFQDQPLPQAAPADRPLVHWSQKMVAAIATGDGWGWTTWEFSVFFPNHG